MNFKRNHGQEIINIFERNNLGSNPAVGNKFCLSFFQFLITFTICTNIQVLVDFNKDGKQKSKKTVAWRIFEPGTSGMTARLPLNFFFENFQSDLASFWTKAKMIPIFQRPLKVYNSVVIKLTVEKFSYFALNDTVQLLRKFWTKSIFSWITLIITIIKFKQQVSG